MSDTIGRISWSTSTLNSSGSDGYIGPEDNPIRVASINWGLLRNTDEPWELAMTLPGFKRVRKCESVTEAQYLAERILTSFVRLIGAEFPGSDQ